ncbi:uncharacterized protein LY89DRAFT_112162 [Mollisia scopiformis]|uniref:Uncharacterized protein n=1 Tax=Mollisia scopiformis TaxID=149040 RepID=A0A194X6I1_MOLSC|nr:uncharacterized protein LY89DRAFT_112162 [Mollisia scopiformis]KUJ15417.1 hypothetical protein LY89DRAFT_112162 [Mollisia scopiformis]
MFSYLRPHHKRTPSNPTSPAEQSHSFESPLHDHGHPPRDVLPPEPTRPPPPPLPPIARVSSADSEEDLRSGRFKRDPRAQNVDFQRDNTRPRDIHAFSNHQRLPYAGMQRPESAGNAIPSNYTSQPKPTFELTSRPRPPDSGQTFADQNRPQGRRPNGARLPSPPPAPPVSTFEPVQQRSGKARLNLLNPMSLLARRRTSQAVAQLAPESLVSNRGNFSETFDPRIRGTVVHDFSAPRPRRNVSYNDVREDTTAPKQFQRSPHGDLQPSDDNATSPWSGGNHTPVFTENFEEEQYPAAGPHVRKASDLTDLPLPQPPYAKGSQQVADPRAATKSNEISQKQIQDVRRLSARKPVPGLPPPVPPKNEGQPEPRRISIDPGATPPKPASSKKGRPRGVSEVSAKDGIPKHMKSTSSRFSFDMIGAAEQERLLEDRHRQKALERKAESADEDRLEEEFENDYDYDNMDDDDGLEERIPGVNADLEDEDDPYADLEEPIPGINTELDEEEDPYEVPQDDEHLGGFTFQQSTLATPMSPSSPGMVSTPRDINGEVIGFAMTRNSPHMAQGMQDPSQPSTSPVSPELKTTIDPPFQGLGLHGIDIQSFNGVKPQVQPQVDEFPRPAALDDDDLYFDDGIITGPGDEEDAVEFDESIFDNVDTDEYGRPLKTLSSLPTLYNPPMLGPDKPLSPAKTNNEPESAASPRTIGRLAPQPSISEPNKNVMGPPQSQGLTQDSLAAYQTALAEAAFTAAANGKFRRDSIPPPTPSEQEDTQPGLVPDSSHTSHYEPFSPSYELEDDFDYDDVLEDDPIIAAANAEALANDCDGFYGQEFGFYSAPAASEAEYANGGYFGPRGVEGVLRSQSGRVASREPNLTPITERSEYSNRNSFMSLSMHGPGSVSSPGLAQLTNMLRSPADYDGEMSLDALLKLRNKAWGGSQASLHSSNGGSPRSAGGLEESSPIGQLNPWQQSVPTSAQGHRRKNSTFSLVSEEASATDTPGAIQSEAGSPPGSPTLTMSFASLDNSSNNMNTNTGARDERDKGIKKHRYTGSAESISYLKEDDPVTGERWILERRRTAESGEVEFLGREVVSGGRI